MKRRRQITLIGWIAAVVSAFAGTASIAAQPPVAQTGPWDQPAGALAEQIAAVVGLGQAHLTVRNLSTVRSDELSAISRLLEQDLKAHGVTTSGAEGASAVRVTLSEDARERLWVAEIVEGTETRVVMVALPPGNTRTGAAASGLTLRKQTVLTTKNPVLAAMESGNVLVAVEPDAIAVFGRGPEGLKPQTLMNIGQKRALARDPRGVIMPAGGGQGFEVWLPGVECTSSLAPDQTTTDWKLHCHESDDPWPIAWPNAAGTAMTMNAATQGNVQARSLSAFYNSARNYFTGVVSPGVGVDLPPFYSAAVIPRPASGVALLISGIDGKVQLAENGALKQVTGARDWGSDFAELHSGCGAGTQIVASGSGEASSDSLRAYEVPSLEAVPASAPLAMEGTVAALWSAPDGMSVLAVVRNTRDEYEVDRVTALCN